MAHNCPVCAVALEVKEYDGFTFEECPQCAGVWLLERELKTIESKNLQDLDRIDELESPLRPIAPGSSALACPLCSKSMDHFHFLIDTPIELDRCLSCDGLWIAHGELTQMATAIESVEKPVTKDELLIARKSEVESEFAAEHERNMEHYRRLTGVFNAMSTRLRLWV